MSQTETASGQVRLNLNGYDIVVSSTGIKTFGPDGKYAETLGERFLAYLRTAQGRKLRQRLRAADDQVIEEIEDDLVRVFQVPQRELNTPDPATPEQRELADRRGLPYPNHINEAAMAGLLRRFERVRTFVRIAWNSMTGEHTADSHIPRDEMNAVVVELMQNTSLVKRIEQAKLIFDPDKEHDRDHKNAHRNNWANNGAYTYADQLRMSKTDPLFNEIGLVLKRRWKDYWPQRKWWQFWAF